MAEGPIVINILPDPEDGKSQVNKNEMCLDDVYEAFGKMIKPENGKYCVYTRDGSRNLGCHDTKADAVRQLGAIEATKGETLSKSSFAISKNDQGQDVCLWKLHVPIVKVDEELREITGVVYEPDVEDLQGDGANADEIRKAAHKFYRRSVLGIMHKEAAGDRAEIVECYTMPADLRVGKVVIKKGTWMMVAKVYDDQLWQDVKDKKITGFSMGGRARVA